jgi:hypothetical protein
MVMTGSRRNALRLLTPAAAGFVFLLGSLAMTALQADENGTGAEDAAAETAQSEENAAQMEGTRLGAGIGGNDQDPEVMLTSIQMRRTERDALFGASPLKPLHDDADAWHDRLYKKTNVRLGTSVHHLFQWLSESLPGTDDWGTATDMDVIGTWEATNRGEVNQGALTMHLEARWDWGTTGPMALGGSSLGMLQNTGNTFDKYVPVTIIRDLYWQKGGPKSKWAMRLGKFTIDGILGTTRHLTPNTSCLSFACTGGFAIALPDSALGVVGVWHFNDRVKLLGSIHDANGDRHDWGDITEGDFFTALDLGVKIWPKTANAGYSKVTLWHTDGTSDGKPINGSTGVEGWGYYLLHEQELSNDGNVVAIFKWGHAFDDSAYFSKQASASFLLYDPHWFGTLRNDSTGISLNWVEPSAAGSRDESGVEVWYKFPLFPGVDTSFNYHAIINPALDPNNDFASAFSIRLTTAF